MRYSIRKLECNFWLDVLRFNDERQLLAEDVKSVIEDRIKIGELPIFTPSVFCIVQKLSNGREKRVGSDVSVDRNGKVIVEEK